MELYDAHVVATQLSIPYRTLMHWIGMGLVRPPGDSGSSKRRRTPVLLSDEDVVEIGRLAQLRRYLRGAALRDVLNTLREMGKNPLSQGDFLVLENRKGQRNVIKILQNKEAIELLHTKPSDRQLRLIPLTGDEVQESIDSGPSELLFTNRPIPLLFDLNQFTPAEIAEIIGIFSEIYHDISGDTLVIDDITLLDPASIMAEV